MSFGGLGKSFGREGETKIKGPTVAAPSGNGTPIGLLLAITQAS